MAATPQHNWTEPAPGDDMVQCTACRLLHVGRLWLDAAGTFGSRQQAGRCPTRFAAGRQPAPAGYGQHHRHGGATGQDDATIGAKRAARG